MAPRMTWGTGGSDPDEHEDDGSRRGEGDDVTLSGPTVPHRILMMELRRMREIAGMTLADVGARLTWSHSKLSRLETGDRRIQLGDLDRLLDLYGVTGDRREVLVTMALESRQKGWWDPYSDVLRGRFPGLEAGASAIRIFEPLLVPGLLQTRDYIRTIVKVPRPDTTDDDVDRRTQARILRQALLSRMDSPELSLVLDEAVLRRTVGGPAVMREQLRRLATEADRPNVTIQVVPFTAGAHPGMSGSFWLLTFPPPAREVVYIEHELGDLYLEEREEIAQYRMLYDALRATALDPDESKALIADAARNL